MPQALIVTIAGLALLGTISSSLSTPVAAQGRHVGHWQCILGLNTRRYGTHNTTLSCTHT